MNNHILKAWPEWFHLIWARRILFTIRYNDRDFKIFDTLLLKEFFYTDSSFSGREISAEIVHILEKVPGVQPLSVVLLLDNLENKGGLF